MNSATGANAGEAPATRRQLDLIRRLRGRPSDAGTVRSASALIKDLLKADRLRKYTEALSRLPLPGKGLGFHHGLLPVANLGARAELTQLLVFRDLRRVADCGSRAVRDSELKEPIDKAFRDARGTWSPPPRRHKKVLHVDKVLPAILAKGRAWNEADLRGASPVSLDGEPQGDAAKLLVNLFAPTDILFIGEAMSSGGEHIRSVAEWLGKDLVRWPHIIPNVLTGKRAPLKSDPNKWTLRGDGCVARYRFAVVEFDDMSRGDQISFWCGCDLPVAALIDSGGKSIHGWLQVDVLDAAAWDAKVRPLFKTHLAPLGVDPMCANPSRLSRLPGHVREGTGRSQRLLFLDPSGKGPRHYLTGGRS